MIKAVFTTITVTVITMTLAAKLFLASVLGLFGLATMPLETFAQLKKSQHIVETMKNKNLDKRKNAHKKFAKKTGKKLASTAVSAATIGTVAVIGTLTYIEIDEYCQTRQDLVDDQNILFGSEETFDFEKCLGQGREDAYLLADEAWQTIQETTSKGFEEYFNGPTESLVPNRKGFNDTIGTMNDVFKGRD